VILEDTWHYKAIARSFQLGQGYILRNFLIILVFFILIFLAALIIVSPFIIFYAMGGAAARDVMAMNYGHGYTPSASAQIISQGLLAPLPWILFVILYYDMRGRKD